MGKLTTKKPDVQNIASLPLDKRVNFFGSDFKFFTFSQLVMLKY
jgi:hypothetical protein